MKKLSLTILFAFSILSFATVRAQTSEFQVKYDIDLSGADIEPMAKMMMQNATIELSFKERAARVVMNMGIAGKTTVIANDNDKKGVMLMNMMGMKMAMNMEEEDFKDAKGSTDELSFEKTGKTKEIAGYTCKHAVGKDDEGNTFDFWYCSEFKPQNMTAGYNFEGIDGFPLEMEMLQDGMHMKMKAKKVRKETLEADLFEPVIPSGYKVMTREEMEKMGRK